MRCPDPRPGYRWVRGLYVAIVPPDGGKDRVADVCTWCFTRKHAPEDCDNPRVTEWFEIADGSVLA